MQKPATTEVTIKKEGRFWAVKTDGKLLAVVLYRKGAEAVQQLLQRLAGLPVTAEADATVIKDPKAKPRGKKAGKPNPKPKPAARKSHAKEAEPVKPALEATVHVTDSPRLARFSAHSPITAGELVEVYFVADVAGQRPPNGVHVWQSNQTYDRYRSNGRRRD